MQQPDGQAAWTAMTQIFLNSSLMGKLKGMLMRPNQDPDEYLTGVFQQRDELEGIDESLTEARIWISSRRV